MDTNRTAQFAHHSTPLFYLPTAPPNDHSMTCLEKNSDKYTTLTSVALASVIGLVAVTTIAGNTLVVVAFATDRKLRTFGNYFILNLAISDLIVGLLICIYAPYLLRGCWQLTHFGCIVFLFLDYVVPLASAWNMALISLDRYCSVARPVAYRHFTGTGNRRRAASLGLMLVPWLVGAVWYGPTVLFWSKLTDARQRHEHGDIDQMQCRVEFYDNVAYLVTSSCVEFLSPFVTVATINVLIYANIRHRSSCLAASTSSSTPSTSSSGLTGNVGSRRQLMRDKRRARSLAVLVIVFLVTWAPFEVCSFVNPVCGFCIPDLVFEVAFWLLWLNSTVNPALYPFLQLRFRVAFVAILRCRTSSMFHPEQLQSAAVITALRVRDVRGRSRNTEHVMCMTAVGGSVTLQEQHAV